jgi:surface antigen
MGGGIGGSVLSSVIRSMGSNVLNGQIGSKVSQSDQNYRLQQLGGAVNSGTVNQPQQWTNPQTGNTVALNPVGQQTVHPQTQHTCQNLQESAISPNGQRITETRLACQDPQTGKWNLVR